MFLTSVTLQSRRRAMFGNLSLIVFAVYFCFVVVEVGNPF